MRIGVPKEVLNNENRVSLTPSGVEILVDAGHEVVVETNAGKGSSFSDEEYERAGAKIVADAKDAWDCDLIMKVKEPRPEEYGYLREGLIIFAYLHLAAAPGLVKVLTEKRVTAIAYETIRVNGSLPLLTPMSEVAGRMATQVGAQFLQRPYGGKGILLAGVPGVPRAKVTIIGGGVVGTNAAKMAAGLGAQVTVIDVNADRLRQLDDIFGSEIHTLMSNPINIANAVAESDLVVGAVLIPGAKAPTLVTEKMVQSMSPGSVIVDVAVDQGGIFETVDRTTSHDNPTYIKHGVIHYAVPNMPGAVPRTSTIALTNVTVPYALQIANMGIKEAILTNESFKLGVNTAAGAITYEAIARDLGYEYVPVETAFENM